MRTICKINPDHSTFTLSQVSDDVTGIFYSPKEQSVAFFNTSTGQVGFVNDAGEIRFVPRRLEVDHPIAMCCDQWGIVALQASQEILWCFSQSMDSSERMCGRRAFEETRTILPDDPAEASPCSICRLDKKDVIFAAPWVHRIIEIRDGIRRDYAGNGKKGFMSSSNPQMAMMDSPSGVCFDLATGTLFVSDTGNSVVRAFKNHKEVACVGMPGKAGHLDGKGSSARLERPSAICASDGVVSVADGNRVVQFAANTLLASVIQTCDHRIVSLAAGVRSLYVLEEV